MGYAIREVTCTSCGKMLKGRYKPKPPWLCLECGVAKMVGSIVDQHNKTGPDFNRNKLQGEEQRRQFLAKSGPWYEKWVAGIEKAKTPPPC